VAALDLACRLTLLIVFAASAASKLRGRHQFLDFRRSVRSMTGLSPSVATAAAIVVATLEVAVVLLMASPTVATGIAGFVVAGCLILGFEWAIASSLRRGVAVPCRCFGTSDSPVGLAEFARNLVLLAIAVLGLVGGLGPLSLSSLGEGLLVAFGSAVVAWMLVNLEALLWLLGLQSRRQASDDL